MGKDGIRLLVAIEKRLNFRAQRDRKIQDRIDGNSLGNRWRRTSGKCAFCKMNPEDWSNDQILIADDPVHAFDA